MITYFFDTNAIIKAYRLEPGTDWINSILAERPQPHVYIAEMARIEVPSTLYKIERETRNDPALTNWARNRFERDLRLSVPLSEPMQKPRRYTLVTLDTSTLARAANLVEQYRSGQPNALRSLDGIQLACAILAREALALPERGELAFVTVDKQLQGVARHQGFTVINPAFPPPPAQIAGTPAG